MNKGKVSVIMPCFNDGAYIMEAIQSLENQSYHDYELLVIDDGSDDIQTIEILNSLDREYFTLLKTNHLGPSGARNYGIEHSNGEYILPLDSDDKIEPTYIEQAVRILKEDKNVGVVYCHADLFGEQTGKWELPEYSLESMLLDNIVFVTALFRKEDWETVGGFRTNMKHGMEDYDFWLSILEIGKEIYQLPEVLFHYRIKPKSRTTQFQENVTVVQQTYQMIYYNHPKLYDKYRDEYAVILRDALIDQIFLNKMYQKSIYVIEKLKKIPVLKNIIKKLILR